MADGDVRMRLSAAEKRREALQAELLELGALLPDIRAAFGNPYSYSQPDNDEEGVAKFTGHSSHDVILPTVLELRQVEQDIERLRAELRSLGL